MAKNKDITEIISFINSYDLENTGQSINYPVERLSAYIDEEFLKERAIEIKKSIITNRDFQDVLSKLASICNSTKSLCDVCPVSKYCNTYISNARKSVTKDSLTMVDLFCVQVDCL